MDRTTQEISHFTNLPHVWWGARTPAGQKRYDNKALHFAKTCNIKKGLKILEVGCGDGEFTKRLARVIDGESKITAIDITPKLINRAKGYIRNANLTFKVADLERLPFTDRIFDVVCGISILHHVNIKRALGEINRVLKKDGEIFFTEPNMLNPHVYLGLHIKPLRKRMECSDSETAFIRWQLLKILENARFRNIEVKNYDFLHPHTPKFLIGIVERMSQIAEKILLIKEISGSLMIYAKK